MWFTGVEAGKKAAGEVLALQKRVLTVLNEATYGTSDLCSFCFSVKWLVMHSIFGAYFELCFENVFCCITRWVGVCFEEWFGPSYSHSHFLVWFMEWNKFICHHLIPCKLIISTNMRRDVLMGWFLKINTPSAPPPPKLWQCPSLLWAF